MQFDLTLHRLCSQYQGCVVNIEEGIGNCHKLYSGSVTAISYLELNGAQNITDIYTYINIVWKTCSHVQSQMHGGNSPAGGDSLEPCWMAC